MITIRSQKQLDELLLRWQRVLLSHTYSDFIKLSFQLGIQPSYLLIRECGQGHDERPVEELQASNDFGNDFLSELSRQISDVIDAILIRKGCAFEKGFDQPKNKGNRLPENISKILIKDVISIIKLNNFSKLHIINAIEDNTFPYITLGQFLQGGAEAKRCLRRLEGVDINTVTLIDFSVKALLAKEPLLNSNNENELTKISHLSLWDLYLNVDEALQVLTDREQKVLRMRFGVGMNTDYTLEAVGKKFRVTRERIRQIEVKALRKLRHPCRINSIKDLCMLLREEIFHKLSNDVGVVEDESYKHRMKEVDSRLVFAIVLAEGGLNKWLDKFFPKIGSGWSNLYFSQIELLVAEQKIKKYINAAQLPMPISSLQELGDSDVLKAVLALSNIANQFNSYLCKRGSMHERIRRAIRLHQLAHQYFPHRMFEARGILEQYNKLFPDSETNLRLIEMDMSKYSHLFVRVYEHLWCSLGNWDVPEILATETQCEIEEEPDEHAGKLEREKVETLSITETLVSILKEEGPMSFVDLRQAMRNILGLSFPDGSMVLVNLRDEFVRLAPGIYALSDYNVLANTSNAGLTEFQCRVYSVAKKGGELDEYYPLWTRKYEMDLCEWAKTSVDRRLYESLLDVVEPLSWPCSNEISVEWAFEQTNNAHYQLYRDPKPDLVKPEICPVEFLSILKYLEYHGSISWMTINRCMSERLDSMCAVWMFGLLASVKVIQIPEHWQLPHKRGDNLGSILSGLESELISHGKLNWHKGVSKDVLELACGECGIENRASSKKKTFRLITENYVKRFSSTARDKIDGSFDEFLEQYDAEKEQNEIDVLFDAL